MTITLYDLAGADAAVRFSPFCWRTRFALLHKGLAFETVPWRFTQKGALAPTGQGRVPVIVDHDKSDRWVNDSWAIAAYLDASYPDRPALMESAADRASAKFVATWADSALHMAAFPLILGNLFENIDEGDKAYFRESREQRLGRTLEAVGVAPEKGKLGFAHALVPAEQALSVAPFLGGDKPAYADYVLAGSLMWVWVTAPVVPLDPASAVGRWFAGMRALFGGAGEKAPLMR